MQGPDLLIDGFGRVREIVHEVLAGLSPADLTYRADPQANTIGWLIWHLTRVQDDHIAGASALTQVWFSGFAGRFGLPFDPSDHGYGHASDQVAAVQAPASLLAEYHDATCDQTLSFLRGLTDDDLPAIVDRSFDPPVTLAVRLVSVLSDDLQHAGQAAFLRGLVQRRGH